MHRPAVEIDAGPAGRGRVEAGIDVVRAGFCAAHRDAAPGEGAEQPDRDAGLARAGARRADDEAACAHADFASTAAPVSSARIDTMSPTTIRDGETKFSASARSATVAERRDQHALDRRRRRHDDGDRRRRRQPARHQRRRDRRQVLQAHIDDDRLAGPGECRPVEVVLHADRMSGRQDDRLVEAAHRRRNAGIGERAEGRGDAGQDAERDLRAGERQGLLAAASEDIGVAALQPAAPADSSRARWISSAVMSSWRADSLCRRACPRSASARRRAPPTGSRNRSAHRRRRHPPG